MSEIPVTSTLSSAASGTRLTSIPEHTVPTPTPKGETECVDVANTPVTDQERLENKLVVLRDMITNLEAYKHHEDDYASVARLSARLNTRYNDVLCCILEVPTHTKSALACQVLTHVPCEEGGGYKTGLGARLAKAYVIRDDIEKKIIDIEAKIEVESRAPLDDFTLVSRKNSVKHDEPNAYDTRPKRYQSARY
ncbi:uncharacterized protein DFL_001343 [Arthrobotrys flagrans]|uniref:Uncharacterized protein n=1 Tax=Arthrobotrys flagrans TaxID=97331 RepID=A0A437AGW2_ARTFL|nr:hypothetical protein DFL_001343 [Arthrobotrys flagrans]